MSGVLPRYTVRQLGMLTRFLRTGAPDLTPRRPAAFGEADWSVGSGGEPGRIVIEVYRLPDAGDLAARGDGAGQPIEVWASYPGGEPIALGMEPGLTILDLPEALWGTTIDVSLWLEATAGRGPVSIKTVIVPGVDGDFSGVWPADLTVWPDDASAWPE